MRPTAMATMMSIAEREAHAGRETHGEQPRQRLERRREVQRHAEREDQRAHSRSRPAQVTSGKAPAPLPVDSAFPGGAWRNSGGPWSAGHAEVHGAPGCVRMGTVPVWRNW